MWKQFIDKCKQLFEPEEELPEEDRTAPTYRSSEAKSKMTYHYPKTGSFRFPMIPDNSADNSRVKKETKEAEADKSLQRTRQRTRRTQSEESMDNKGFEQFNYRRKKENAEEKEKRPSPSAKPFTPTAVPSPVHGFQRQRNYGKDEEITEENELIPSEEEGIPDYETEEAPETVAESEFLDMEDEVEEESDVSGDAGTEVFLSIEEDTGSTEEELPVQEEDEVRNGEPETAVPEEEKPVEETGQGTFRAAERAAEEKENAAEEETSEPATIITREKPGNKETKSSRSSVPFNVIMTPKDKRSRDKKPEEQNTSPKTAEPEKTAELPEQNDLTGEAKRETDNRREYELPLYLFNDKVVREENEDTIIIEQMEQLENTLQQFQVKAKVTDAMKGPTVTRFEVQPEPGVKVSKITNLSDDIKLKMAARDIRMEAPIPGKQAVGIEVPNHKSQMVGLQEIFETEEFTNSDSPLTVGLGLDIAGIPSVTDLKDMPHGLIAGATGSGKSVCINTILLSLLYKSHYEDVKFMLIDPKMVELAPYNGLPQLVSPVITDVKAATSALKWAVKEMEERYEKFVEYGVRDVEKYNDKVIREGKSEKKLPYLVIVIDELADLMMTSPQEVEDAICKIAQKARACGIHLLVATQRPSVDVITGLIKANIPTRIAFSVSSQADSRTVLDAGGAEKLLGKGDMLFMGNGDRTPQRVQGAFVSDEEITRVTGFMKNIAPANYLFEQEELLNHINNEEETDSLFDEAVRFVLSQNGASASLIQRRFRVGYNRAARLVDQMEEHGIISSQKGSKPRDVLLTEQQSEEWKQGELS
ncbi:DNA translocase FtsK [Salimicrobium jeotgali]|uniref:DNA translocase FtsK n=1 Tax=Salimicrobium jeotgali TaxID=1230341 RepID=K2G7T3_9BACI|nr:DNA translocase FtsK [Salimicrobium jeotgali]AKG04075.1 DNA translocase FtsK [Salimicrobium jeotgali]EKE31193.1 DNA translocase SftA [Salimicrobium jeotgali]MBM7697245.1 S-DNA-T family DNA segregation ATPase FtsK/SpoIIIE [Salimicrobium jeotgali]